MSKTYLDGASRTQVCLIKTGIYTGDGAATKVITGVGFTPKYLIILRHGDYIWNFAQKNDQDGANTLFHVVPVTSQWSWWADHIISFDADGFTVGDGSAGPENIVNVNLNVYTYIALG